MLGRGRFAPDGLVPRAGSPRRARQTVGFEGSSDITDQKRSELALRASEERFRALVENSYEVVGIMNREGQWVYISPSVLRIWGYTVEEMLALERFGSRVHPDDVRPLEARFRELVENPLGISHMQFRARHKDGSWRELEIFGINRVDDPSVGGVVINFRDITERKQGEERLRRSYEQIRALAARMETVREEESSRIARELHDQIGRALTAIKIQLQTLGRSPERRRCRGARRGLDVTDRALEAVRNLSLDLRPAILDDLGLPAALRWYLDRQAQRAGFQAELSALLSRGALPGNRDGVFPSRAGGRDECGPHARATRVRVDPRGTARLSSSRSRTTASASTSPPRPRRGRSEPRNPR